METIQICLPKAAEWDAAENYAENLRMSAAGCVPVGMPRAVLSDAGAQTVTVDGRVLTVDADGRTLRVDGVVAGTLSGRFLSALPDGERVIIFTDEGVEWLSGSVLQGGAPELGDVAISSSQASQQLTVEVVPPSKLSGTYTRTAEALQAADCRAMVAPIEAALAQLRVSASARGLLLCPAWVSWRMVDVDGRVVAQGEPQRVGSLPDAPVLTFTAAKSGTTVTLGGSSALSLPAFGLTLSVVRSGSEFWRKRIKSLEVILWPDCMAVSGTTGHINIPELTVTPKFVETARSGAGIIVARTNQPLEGVNAELRLENFGAAADYDVSVLKVSASHSAGTLNAYALADESGVLAVAPAADPLRVVAKARICRGRILSICSPAGTGGGWNYGRHHLLAFASDGVFAVSIDGGMKKVSASPICGEGIVRTDAVSLAPDAVYMASSLGNLLKIKGARVERLNVPVAVAALCWSGKFGELWLLGADATAYVLTARGDFSARTVIGVQRFVEPALAVDSRGALRSLAQEESVATMVQWWRCVARRATALEQRAEWLIDAADTLALTLSLSLGSGGTPQRALDLNINGPVNAPIAARFRAPRREYLTAAIRGLVAPPARLRALRLSPA